MKAATPIAAALTASQKALLHRALVAHSGRTLTPYWTPKDQQALDEILVALVRGLFSETRGGGPGLPKIGESEIRSQRRAGAVGNHDRYTARCLCEATGGTHQPHRTTAAAYRQGLNDGTRKSG